MEENKTSRWAYLMVVPILVIIIGFIVYYSNQYYDLSHFTKKDLDNLYIKGRNSRYNKALNYLYGDRIKAAKLPDGFSDDVPLIFYDKNGKEKLKILFYSNQKLVRINNKKYLYRENNIAIHRAKELYPDKNKSDCEKMMFNIIKLYDNDNNYMWDYYNEKDYEFPKYYTNGVHFSNEGINVTILEYKDDTIENDYIKECNRIKSWYGGTLLDTFISKSKIISNYVGANKNSKFTIIKYDKFIISIKYSYEYINHNSAEVNNNIETLNKYLKELNIL